MYESKRSFCKKRETDRDLYSRYSTHGARGLILTWTGVTFIYLHLTVVPIPSRLTYTFIAIQQILRVSAYIYHDVIVMSYTDVSKVICVMTYITVSPILAWTGGTIINIHLTAVSSPSCLTPTLISSHQILHMEPDQHQHGQYSSCYDLPHRSPHSHRGMECSRHGYSHTRPPHTPSDTHIQIQMYSPR